MKRIVFTVLAIALLFTALVGCERVPCSLPDECTESKSESNSASASVSDEPSDPGSSVSDFEYAENEGGGITIAKYIGTDKHVVIPAKITGKDVTVIGELAFGDSEIISVKIPDSVTLLEKVAFGYCLSLTEIQLSQNLKSIGDGCFIACIVLPSVKLPQSLEKIGDHAFEHCLKLSDVKLPSNLKYLGMKAFYETVLKQINIPKSIETWGSQSFASTPIETIELEQGLKIIGEAAFMETQIKEIDIPGSVKEISDSAFSSCPKLQSVILHEGLSVIDQFAFSWDPELSEIVIPKTVNNIKKYAFHCNTLKKIKFDGDAPEYFLDDESAEKSHYIIYYHESASGFTHPTWNGYHTEIW